MSKLYLYPIKLKTLGRHVIMRQDKLIIEVKLYTLEDMKQY